MCYPEETAINYKDADMYKDGKKQQHIITSQKKAGVALWVSDRGTKNDITEWHKRSIQQDTIILNVYAANKRTTKQTEQKMDRNENRNRQICLYSRRLQWTLLTQAQNK